MAKRILRKWTGYTLADCDCRYCLYGGTGKGQTRCRADRCVCAKEIAEAESRERKEIGAWQ